jgi:hypothetical protein
MSSTVHSVRLSSAHLTGTSRLFRNAHDPGHWANAASGGLDPDPAVRVRGASPHLLCSKAALNWPRLHHGLLSAPSWRTIIGVMPARTSLDFLDPHLWRPLTFDVLPPRSAHELQWAIAKLKPGVTLGQARTQMDAIGDRLARAYPESNKNYGVVVEPFPVPSASMWRRPCTSSLPPWALCC